MPSRKKQIDTLKKDVGSLTEVEKDVQYEVVVAPGSDVRLLVYAFVFWCFFLFYVD